MINEAVKNTYTMPRLARGHSMEDMLQGGSTIKDTIYFKVKSTYKRYHPNRSFTYENKQTGTTWEIPWRFAEVDVSWTEHEIGLNTGQLSSGAKFHRFKNLMRQKMQNLWSDACNAIDDEYWAVPDTTTMESTTGKEPYSIPVYLNEYDDGLPIGDDRPGGAWTTVMGISPTAAEVDDKWTPEQQTYTEGAVAGTDMFPAMSRTFHKLRFDRLPKKPEYSDKTTSPHFIGCSLQGLVNYEDALRLNQDQFKGAGRQDPDYDRPTFRGVPLDYISALDDAVIYPTGENTGDLTANLGKEADTTNTSTNSNAGNAGPRYYFINGEYMRQVFHNERYFYMLKPIQPSEQPFNRVQIVDMWNNLVCRSRRRHGILYPAKDITPS
jgi:hypothetical protein